MIPNDQEASRSPHRPWMDRTSWILVIAFAAFVTLLAEIHPGSWADASRLATIENLVTRGTFAIDASTFEWTGDRVRIGTQHYSHHPPLLSILGALPWAMLHGMGFRLPQDLGVIYRTLTVLFCALPWLLMSLAIRRRLLRLAPRTSAWLPAALLFGSLATPYTLVLNHHVPAAVCAYAALAGAFAPREGGACQTVWGTCRAGLWMGLAIALDPGTSLLALAIGCVLLTRLHRGRDAMARSAAFVLGNLPGIILAASLNMIVSGHPWPIGMERGAFEFEGSAFVVEPLTGFLPERTLGETLHYAWRTTFGTFGVFFYHPWLLLGVIGAGLATRTPRTRSCACAILLGTALVVLAFSLLSDNFSGACFGIRWYVAFVPWLGLGVPWGIERIPRRLGNLLVGATLCWSFGFAALGSLVPWAKYNPLDRPAELAAEDMGRGRSLPEKILAEARRVRSLQPRFTRDELNASFRRSVHAALEHPRSTLATLSLCDRLLRVLHGEESLRAATLARRARCFARIGDVAAAIEDWESVLEITPEDVRARFEHAWLLACRARVPGLADREVLSLRWNERSQIESDEPDLAARLRALTTAMKELD